MSADTKTIHEFLAENPDVDVSRAWERCFGILAGFKDRIAARFPVTRHPSCAGREYYTSPDGKFEGSFNAYSGGGVEWLVHSWLGNRKASILDMNATCFLGQESDTPHLIVIFGTIPKLFFYADYVPRRDLRTDGPYRDGPCIRQACHPLTAFVGHYPLISSWVVGDRACGIGIREDSSLVTLDSARFVPHAIVEEARGVPIA